MNGKSILCITKPTKYIYEENIVILGGQILSQPNIIVTESSLLTYNFKHPNPKRFLSARQ